MSNYTFYIFSQIPGEGKSQILLPGKGVGADIAKESESGLLASGAIATITNASRAMPTLVCGTAKMHKCFLGLSLVNSSVTLN